MVGGGQGAFIGAVHRIAARIDDRYELVAGCLASDPERAHASAAELGIAAERSYGDFAEMAKAEAGREDGIDAVSIVTPNHVHAGPIIAFAEQGIHVICDKPMCDTLANAEKAAAALEKAKVCFLLTHNYSGYPLVRHARSLVAGGELGPVRAVRAAYMQDWLARPLEKEGLKQAVWRTDPKLSGPAGSLGDIGTHAFQLARYITGLELASVAADVRTCIEGRQLDDHAEIMLRYEGGATGSLTCSQIAVGHENDLTIAVYCENGSVRWAQENPNELTLVHPYGSPARRLTRSGPELGEWAAAATRTPPGHPEGYLEAFAQLYRDMADVIEAGGKQPADAAPLPGIADGLTGMRFVDAALRSSAAKGA
ncbi:MAG: Gfo/Idh/MocA family oxidoreductase, partial [Betaproteobacteria bacterium AqS2]|nr:Gfo/Idh/MocA family oxidoreductase [Betaproteobacteria bacterium AqS2]